MFNFLPDWNPSYLLFQGHASISRGANYYNWRLGCASVRRGECQMHLTHSLYLSLKNRSVEILWTAQEKGQVYFYRQCKVNTLKPPPTRQKSGEQEKYGTIVKTISILESWLARFSLIYFLSYESILVKACAVK